MNLHRIKTIVLHSWHHLNHSKETWVDLYWYSVINIMVFGFISVYFSRQTQGVNFTPLLAGMILWEVIVIGQYSLGVGALWEIWSKSLSSMFITPLTLEEFVTGQMIGGLIKSLMVFVLVSALSWWFYQFSILILGWMLVIYYLQLLVFSFSTGMFIIGLIFRIGTDIQSLSWGLVYILQPVAGIFYPVSVLPGPVQTFAYMFPVTYVFESVHAQLVGQNVQPGAMMTATILNILYFIGSYIFMRISFAVSKKSGTFARMEN